jgi:hypothetical protein
LCALSHVLQPDAACAQVCTTNADCKIDHECKPTGGATSGCEGGEICQQHSTTSATSQCQPVIRMCNVESDCPEGLACKPGLGGGCLTSRDGGTSCSVGPDVCTWVQAQCSSTQRACPDSEECVVAAKARCPDVKGASCVLGDDLYACAPKYDACTVDTDCPEGATCFLLSELRWGVPVAWNAVSGRTCLSKALAFAMSGYAAFDGIGFGETTSATDSEPTAKTGAKNSASGGCSVRGHARASTAQDLLALLAVMLGATRRGRWHPR